MIIEDPFDKGHKTFWLTRDHDGTTLSLAVDVWLQRPTRQSIPGGGAMWLGPGDTGLESRWGCWSLGQCKYTLPETDRECVRIGDEPPEIL